MINIDRRFGLWSGRVWGLILNFIGNGLAIYGAIGYIRDGSRLLFLIIGMVLTLGCLLILAIPSSSAPDEDKHDHPIRYEE